VGVRRDISIKERFDEIDREVCSIAVWFHKPDQSKAALNAQLVIAECLASRFRDFHQIDEELACLSEARRVQADFAYKSGLKWLAWPFARYMAWCLKSLTCFGFIVLGWLVLYAFLNCWLFSLATGELLWWDAIQKHFLPGVVSFVTLNPPIDDLEKGSKLCQGLWALGGL